MARDICFYRRHHFKPDTLRALMILMYIDRFLLLKDLEKIETTEEAKKARLPKKLNAEEVLEARELKGLISDNEDSND
jgi:hypothetical protein